MPATRKSSRGAAAKSTGRQSTLSFNNRVSKAGATRASAKDAATLAPSPVSAAKKKSAVEPAEDGEENEQLENSTQRSEKDEEVRAVVQERPQAEVRAGKITEAHVKKYWREVEAARIAKRVHQEELTLAEKVLRYFDISSQYGPCIGIPRIKRWYRAEKLGLNPPIEVLAVLLKEEKQGNRGIERSAMDRHLESTAIGSL